MYDSTVFSKCYLTISTLSRSPESVTCEHKLTYLWKFIISFVKLDSLIRVFCQRNVLRHSVFLWCLTYCTFLCVSCGYFLLFLIALLELQGLIRITRASGPLFFAYHVALNNIGLLEWGTASVNLVTIHDLYLLQHIINVIPVIFSVMLVNISFTQHCKKGTAGSVTIMLSNTC